MRDPSDRSEHPGDDSVVVVFSDGSLGGCSQGFLEQWGLSPEAIAGQSATRIFTWAAHRARDPKALLGLLAVPYDGASVQLSIELNAGGSLRVDGSALGCGPGGRRARLWRFTSLEAADAAVDELAEDDEVDAGRPEFVLEGVAVQSLLLDALAQVSAAAQLAKVSLVRQVETTANLLGDRERLLRVLTHLLSGALRGARAGDVVHCRVRDGRAGFARFEIEGSRDHAPDDGGAAHAVAQGIARCRSTIEHHGGAFAIDSAGGGWWFEVPAVEAQIKPARAHVLLVSRDERLSRMLGLLVVPAGHRLVRVVAIASAQRLIAHEPPAGVIVDLDSIPGGAGVLDALARGDGRAPTLVALSSRAAPAAATLASPRWAWLRKPIDGADLLAALHVRA